MPDQKKLIELEKIAKLLRYHILTSTTRAGSGHPTSSLSATKLMAGLLFGGAFHCLTVRKRPVSGNPQELLDYEEISSSAIIKKIQAAMDAAG
ncbi:MAG: hypothetical protein M0036_19615 [Desulfobacteraceae bacterium]|nr:hypothetical protein [Desulfobacteraceae bacterium]